MGRVIDDGGVFAPRLELKRIQQGRIPFRERLAERYLSPTGVAQTMKNVGQIASLLGEIEFDPMKQKTGQDAAKSVAQQRIGGELPEGMTRVGMATGQGAPTSTTTPERPLPEGMSRVGVVEGQGAPFAERVGAQVGRGEPTQVATTDPKTREISEVATIVSEKMRDAGRPGLPRIEQDPKATQETYQLQMELVASGDLSPEEWATGPGILGRRTKRAMARRDARTQRPQNLTGLPTAAAARPGEMPAEPYVPSAVTPATPRAPSVAVPAEVVAAAPVPQAMEPEPYVPTDRPAAPAAAPVAAPVAPAAAPAAPAMTLKQRVQKVLDDISAPTYEGQQNALRAMAMQADTAEAQSAIMNALSEVRIPSRGLADLFRPQSRRAAFREEIRRLFPGVKKPPAPMTEKERLGLETQQKRLEITEKQLEAAEERRADEKEARKREADEKKQKSKTGKSRGALRAGRGTGKGRRRIDKILERELTENNKQLGKKNPTTAQYSQNIGRAKSDLRSLRSQEKKLQTPLRKNFGKYPEKKKGERPYQLEKRVDNYSKRVTEWKDADEKRKEQLEAVQGKIKDYDGMVKGYETGIQDVQANFKRQKLYQTALSRLQVRGQRMTVEKYEDYADRLLSINMSDQTNEERIKSFRVVLDELAGKKPEAQKPRQGGDEGTKNRNLTTLQRQLSSIEDDIKTSKFTVTVDPAQDSMGRQGVTVEGNISQELKSKIIRAVRGGRYLGNKIITLPVGGN